MLNAKWEARVPHARERAPTEQVAERLAPHLLALSPCSSKIPTAPVTSQGLASATYVLPSHCLTKSCPPEIFLSDYFFPSEPW